MDDFATVGIMPAEATFLKARLDEGGLPQSSNCREMQDILAAFVKTFRTREGITTQMLYDEMGKLSTTD
ncbi:MAG: hypothetical protein HOA84_06065 [Candidatus Jacksonbacteria bacterium]|jgi:hypothetical protein|nr:hypothetical protein [Candidatus Jacksonbacteria bacterium]